MPITSGDLSFRLTTKSGSAGDTTTSTPNNSLGKYVSTTAFSAGLNSLLDDVTGAENLASTVDYRAFAIVNTHATLTLTSAVVYMSAETAGGANIAIAVDNLGPVAKGSASAQGAEIATETTAPSGVGAFSSPTTAGTGLSLGNLGPNQARLVWVRRTATNSTALSGDSVTFAVSGDTAA